MGAANSSSVLSDENLHTSFGETESNYRVIEINATNPIHGNHSQNSGDEDALQSFEVEMSDYITPINLGNTFVQK